MGKRALCLAAIYFRSPIERQIEQEGSVPKDDEESLTELWMWMKAVGLDAAASRQEKEMLMRPPGAWSRRDIVDASWRSESLGAMLWALKFVDYFPAYGEEFDTVNLFKMIPFFSHTADWVSKAALRPAAEIFQQRDVAEMWHWRARTLELEQAGADPPPGVTFPQMVAMSAKGGHDQGQLPAPVDSDFPVRGRAFGRLSEEDFSELISSIVERHRSLNWLCGYADDWDETPTDT